VKILFFFSFEDLRLLLAYHVTEATLSGNKEIVHTILVSPCDSVTLHRVLSLNYNLDEEYSLYKYSMLKTAYISLF